MHYKRKVFIFIYINLLLFILVLSSQIIIDPYGIFKFIHIDHINDKTYFNRSKGRVENSLHLHMHDYQTIIMGTSRAQGGMDISNINFKNTNVLNASLSGAYFQEISSVLTSILAQQKKMKHLIYGIDFFTFTYTNPKHLRFKESLYYDKNYFFPTLIKNLLSWEAMEDMMHSIQLNLQNSDQEYWTYGQIHTDMIKRNHRKAFNSIVPAYFQTYSYYKESNYILNKFEKTMTQYAKKKIRVSLFISPIHARQMIIIDSEGLLPAYYKWMKNITSIIYKINQKYSSNIELYNFSGFNSITTEIIPSDKHKQMQYYHESSHYTVVTGNLVLNTLFHHKEMLPNFGIALTPDTINDHILKIEKDKETYYNTFPKEVEEIRQHYMKYTQSRK